MPAVPSIFRHPMDQIGTLANDAQGDAQGFVDPAVLLAGQHIGSVGVPDLTAEAQGMLCLQLRQHAAAIWAGQRGRIGYLDQTAAADAFPKAISTSSLISGAIGKTRPGSSRTRSDSTSPSRLAGTQRSAEVTSNARRGVSS